MGYEDLTHAELQTLVSNSGDALAKELLFRLEESQYSNKPRETASLALVWACLLTCFFNTVTVVSLLYKVTT